MDLSGPILEPPNATLNGGVASLINLPNGGDEGISVKQLSGGASDGEDVVMANPTAELMEREEEGGEGGRESELRGGADSPQPVLGSQQELF